jgi:hypothetical protein
MCNCQKRIKFYYPDGGEIPFTVFMNAKQFREFSDRFQVGLKSVLEELRLKRIRSEEDARGHLVY